MSLFSESSGWGFRNLNDIVEAYDYKLWWRFHLQKSLWAKFLHQKYLMDSRPNEVVLRPGSPQTWKCMMAVRDFKEEKCVGDVK